MFLIYILNVISGFMSSHLVIKINCIHFYDILFSLQIKLNGFTVRTILQKNAPITIFLINDEIAFTYLHFTGGFIFYVNHLFKFSLLHKYHSDVLKLDIHYFLVHCSSINMCFIFYLLYESSIIFHTIDYCCSTILWAI